MILYGKPGIGKTSIASDIASEFNINYRFMNATINNKADFTLIFRKESGDVVNLCVAAQYQDELSLFFVADVAGDSYDEDSIYYPKEIAEKIITFLTQEGKTLKESLTEHMGYLHVIDNTIYPIQVYEIHHISQNLVH